MIDEEKFVEWLRDRSHVTSPLVGAIYQGLAERVERGDFDKEGGTEDGPHMVQS